MCEVFTRKKGMILIVIGIFNQQGTIFNHMILYKRYSPLIDKSVYLFIFAAEIINQ